MTTKARVVVSVLVLSSVVVGFVIYTPIYEHQKKSKQLLEQAKSAHLNNDLEAATERFQELIEFDAENEKARILLGIVFMDRGLFDEAEKQFNMVIERDPKAQGVYGFLSSLFFEKGEYDQAILYADKSLEINPKSGADLTLGRIALLRKDFLEAENQFLKHIRSWPENPAGFIYLAKTFAQQERIDEAVENYEKAVRLDPTLHRYILEAGKLYEDKGQYSEAVDLYQRTIRRVMTRPIEEALKNAEAKLAK
jgi:Flp pilus assembly protein TadD